MTFNPPAFCGLGAVLLLATAYGVRASPVDAAFLGVGGFILLGTWLLWLTTPVHYTPPAPIGWLFGSKALFVMGPILAARGFITPLRSWPRLVYFVAAIALLTPFLVFFSMIVAIFIVPSHHY